VAGASKGEGLGNQFLANIRECDAIAHVVRCFETRTSVHVAGKVDPVSDIGTINDRARARGSCDAGKASARYGKVAKTAATRRRSASRRARQSAPRCSTKARPRAACPRQEEQAVLKPFFLLTAKPAMSETGSTLPATCTTFASSKAAHHVRDGVALADIGEELVAQAFALRGAGHESRDIDELDRGGDELSAASRWRQALQGAGRALRRCRYSDRWCRTDSSPPRSPPWSEH